MEDAAPSFEHAAIDRDREQFLLSIIGELADVLQDNIGVHAAEGFIAMVGNRTGVLMNQDYQAAAGTDQLDPPQVAAALVDLKRRIEGGFSIESIDAERIVLVNDRCPFGAHVDGRPALCMMTSNVFGRIAAENLGHSRVVLQETIARGDGRCRVLIYLDGRQSTGEGREYFG